MIPFKFSFSVFYPGSNTFMVSWKSLLDEDVQAVQLQDCSLKTKTKRSSSFTASYNTVSRRPQMRPEPVDEVTNHNLNIANEIISIF